VDSKTPFCEIPGAFRDGRGGREKKPILLPQLDAVLGNPPYVRHEHIPKASETGVQHQSKEYIHARAEQSWPEIGLSKQSDLHVYFWPLAASFLVEGGWFGFLTSSSWLDVRYGFALQRWILLNFKLVAVIESLDEPWFEDARVKTVVTILQRTSDEGNRRNNPVRFVRLFRPLAEILGTRDDESQRQIAAEKLRDIVLRSKSDFCNHHLRILTKRQGDLWDEGLSVAQMFAKQKALAQREIGQDTGENSEDDVDAAANASMPIASDYGGGKWGRYLRAPDFYFKVMREYGSKFVRLGDITAIRFGIKSGCDAFFMPRNVTPKLLEDYPTEQQWRSLPMMTRCSRKDETGQVIVVRCGDGTLHPVEGHFFKPEVHSLMQVDRPLVEAEQLDRVVLWVSEPLETLKGTLIHQYITWGGKQTFSSKKSKSVPIPLRPTCAGRPLWYDLTGLKAGIGFWPMAQQYRHIIPANPFQLPCNHNLFDIHSLMSDSLASEALMPILNSSLVALIKTFYGRYAGTEGNLKTEIVDVVMLEIPDPRNINDHLFPKLQNAFKRMQGRRVTHLVEQKLLDCHTAVEVREVAKSDLRLPAELQQPDRRELDEAVLELLGVNDPNKRTALIDQLYRELALHFRAIRIVEVQKMEQRRRSGNSRNMSAQDLALDAWTELDEDMRKPLSSWLIENLAGSKLVKIPEGAVRLPDASHFFEANTVFFGSKPATSLDFDNREQAELVHAIALAGIRDSVFVPATPEACRQAGIRLSDYLLKGSDKLTTLAASRAGSDKIRAQVFELLYRWFIGGKPN
jgi:hypothetical protein